MQIDIWKLEQNWVAMLNDDYKDPFYVKVDDDNELEGYAYETDSSMKLATALTIASWVTLNISYIIDFFVNHTTISSAVLLFILKIIVQMRNQDKAEKVIWQCMVTARRINELILNYPNRYNKIKEIGAEGYWLFRLDFFINPFSIWARNKQLFQALKELRAELEQVV